MKCASKQECGRWAWLGPEYVAQPFSYRSVSYQLGRLIARASVDAGRRVFPKVRPGVRRNARRQYSHEDLPVGMAPRETPCHLT